MYKDSGSNKGKLMSKIIILLVLISSYAMAQSDECQLGSDNSQVIRTIIKTVYPVDTYSQSDEATRQIYYSYPREARMLMNYVAIDLHGFEFDSIKDIMFYFDDFNAFVIKGNITVVDFGVGGGNGGYVYLDSNHKLLAEYFDGDLLFCDAKYRKN
jgi:hypothetical protein